MPRELVKAGGETRGLGPLASVAETAREYIRHAKAPNTMRAYRADWKHFKAWCDAHGLTALPAAANTAVLYLTELSSTHKVSTLTRRLSSINQAHQLASHESPTGTPAVRALMAGIRRAKGTAPEVKAPVLTEDIRAMVGALPAGLLGSRDRALLLIGFTGAFRRSELVGLNFADCEFTRAGLVISLRRSKTDQDGCGRKIGIPRGSTPETCPVRSLEAWLAASGITGGALFRSITRQGRMRPGRLSAYAVALVVKRCAAAVGLDASRYSGHSLRAGLATAAAIAGASERSIMNQTGHRSTSMVRRYIRDGSLFRENAAAVVGLCSRFGPE